MYTEINLLNEYYTDEILLNLIKAGYEVAYEVHNESSMVIGVKNPMKYYGFVEVVDFYFKLRDNSEEILKEIGECLSVPFALKLIVENVEGLF